MQSKKRQRGPCVFDGNDRGARVTKVVAKHVTNARAEVVAPVATMRADRDKRLDERQRKELLRS
jgi:hypothetical protein